MCAGRMRKRMRKTSTDVILEEKATLEPNEEQRQNKRDFIYTKAKASAPPVFWPCSITACSRDISFVLCLSGKWLVVIQSDCLSLGRVSERIWGNVYRPAHPAASINLLYQIICAEINLDWLADMQIPLLYLMMKQLSQRQVEILACAFEQNGDDRVTSRADTPQMSTLIVLSLDQMFILCKTRYHIFVKRGNNNAVATLK